MVVCRLRMRLVTRCLLVRRSRRVLLRLAVLSVLVVIGSGRRGLVLRV